MSATTSMHRAHDYPFLIRRWREVARMSGLNLRRLVKAGGRDLYYLRTPALGAEGGFYVSAGIHGDEVGGTEGLISWAEHQGARLAQLPALIFPCLNPWGITCNIRCDSDGTDLNRLFHREDHPVIAAIKSAAAGHRFAAAMMLHEDYDGEGVYLYELERSRPNWGEELLSAAKVELPLEPRSRVDGRLCRDGLIRRKLNYSRFEKIGYPEALWLHMERSDRSFTLETPSEFPLAQRAAVHRATVDRCVSLLTGKKGLPGAAVLGNSARPRISYE